MTIGELVEALQEFPDETSVMVDISAVDGDREYDVYYDIVGVDENAISNIAYIVAE